MGAPIGNTNALKTGRRTTRPGTVLARLGKRFSQPYADVCRLRRQLESQLGPNRGALTLSQSAKIQTLCRLELSARIAELSIRNDPDMTAADLRSQRACITQWSRERDNLLNELLGDGKPAADPWAALSEAPIDESRQVQP